MKCTGCGKEIPDDDLFCSYCGKETEVNDPFDDDDPNQKQAKLKIIYGILGVIIFLTIIGMIVFVTKNNKPKENTEVVEEQPEKIESQGEYYVTGRETMLTMYKEPARDSEVVGNLENGEKVLLLEKENSGYWNIYHEKTETKGYVDLHYLTPKAEAVCSPKEMYVDIEKDEVLDVLDGFEEGGAVVGELNRADSVVILARPSGDFYYVYIDGKEIFGYVKKDKLVGVKPGDEEEEEKGFIFGRGSAPTEYAGVYYVDIETGYLALRNAKFFDVSNELGKMYNGECVYLLDATDSYWYVYSPGLGMYGYANSEYLVSQPRSRQDDGDVYYASVRTGYLALRSAQSFDGSNEIGKIYDGEKVVVLDKSTGTYWYVYVPGLDNWGYVNSEYLRR